MSVIVIGLNHRTAPLELLERVSLAGERLVKALHDVSGRDNVSEAVVLSTCNRTEVYAVAERFHGAYREVRDFFGETAFLAPEDFADHLYVQHDDEAVAHLFSVAAGLDSAVVGETEILRQVRDAWSLAQAEHTAGAQLNALFRHALEVGKRARTDTAIARHVASVSTAAVAMARQRLGSLAEQRILVLGAGDMGEGMVRALVADASAPARLNGGESRVLIANRTPERATELAAKVGGRAVNIADLLDHLVDVDLLLTSTGASTLLVGQADLASVIERRHGRPLLIVDIAVPRDIDPSAAGLPGVTLLDMDDLRSFADAGMAERRCEVGAVRTIVEEELARYCSVASAREVAPLVGSLHGKGESVRAAELDRFRARLADLDERQVEAVEALTKGIVAKLLHEPTVAVKGAAGSAKGERLAESLRDLFDL